MVRPTSTTMTKPGGNLGKSSIKFHSLPVGAVPEGGTKRKLIDHLPEIGPSSVAIATATPAFFDQGKNFKITTSPRPSHQHVVVYDSVPIRR